ncbi:MAG: glycine zipper 2TM domain-containing protein, partial [Proteobacteria bacterium]|nr:glycine zipper 2TM domain-containing protein [Pseudomonadota bacterium]
MKKILLLPNLILLVSFCSTVNAECVQEQTGGGEIVGTLLGAALGGLVGSQFGGGTGKKVAIGAGVLAGGFLGNKVGKSLDCQDQQYHYDTTQNALEKEKTGQTSTWTNPDTG